jgi:hypothetical protein
MLQARPACERPAPVVLKVAARLVVDDLEGGGADPIDAIDPSGEPQLQPAPKRDDQRIFLRQLFELGGVDFATERHFQPDGEPAGPVIALGLEEQFEVGEQFVRFANEDIG